MYGTLRLPSSGKPVAAALDGEYFEIENMTHTLKLIEAGRNDQSSAYTEPGLPVSTQLLEGIESFVYNRAIMA